MPDLVATLFGQFIVLMMLALIPAYLLGRFLPSHSAMSGPFRGLTVSFGGASAFYLFILIFGGGMIGAYHKLLARNPTYEEVVVSGVMRFDGSKPLMVAENQVVPLFMPSGTEIRWIEGREVFDITMTLPVQRMPDGSLEFPTSKLYLMYGDDYTADPLILTSELLDQGEKDAPHEIVLKPNGVAEVEGARASVE